MKDFIEALNILLKYNDDYRPFFCDHDVIYFTAVKPNQVSDDDKLRLSELRVFISDDTGEELFYSFRFGS